MFMAAHFSHHLMTALPAPLLPFIRADFNLDYTQSAWIISAFSLAYGFSQLPGGWLADRINRSIVIAIGILGVAMAGVLLGLSHTYVMTILLLVLMGILGGGYHPAATPWISSAAGEKNQGRALGFHFIGGGAGFFFAPLIATAIAAAWGWHSSFLILAGPAAIFGLIFLLFLRNQTNNNKLQTVAAQQKSSKSAATDRWRSLIALLAMSLVAGGLGSVMSFLSLYLVDDFGVSKQMAGSLVALSSFAGLWAGPVGGHLSDRIGRLPIIVGSAFIGGLLTLSVKFVPYGIGLFALLFFMGVNMYLSAPVSEAFIMGQTSQRHRSTIYGLYYLAGQGGALFAPLMGSLIDGLGFRTTVLIAGISIVVVTSITSYFLVTSREKVPKPTV
jgi:MFS family permease